MPSGKPKAGESLADLFPDVASQWHPTLNGNLTPEDIVGGVKRKYWWKCGVGPDHEWKTSLESRYRGSGCPYCANQRVSVTNSFGVLFPKISLEWHKQKNGDLNPNDVVASSAKKVWWKCDKGPDHEWQQSVRRRTGLGAEALGCPFCANQKVSVTNQLAILAPGLAKEWHPTKNGDLTPGQVVAMTHKKVWWKCGSVPEHEWHAGVSSRTNVGAGCPLCTLTPRSAQEMRLAHELKALIEFNIEAHKIRIGGRLRDVDIILEGLGVIVEFDGAYWHKNKAEKDLEKALKLEAEGWNVIRVRERPLDSIHLNDVMAPFLASSKEVADLVLQKIIEVTGVKIPKLKEYLASDEPWREKEALVAIREYQAENARKKAERDAKRRAKKK